MSQDIRQIINEVLLKPRAGVSKADETRILRAAVSRGQAWCKIIKNLVDAVVSAQRITAISTCLLEESSLPENRRHQHFFTVLVNDNSFKVTVETTITGKKVTAIFTDICPEVLFTFPTIHVLLKFLGQKEF